MEELGKEHECNTLWSDSQSAVHLARNSAFYARTKHIETRYHFIRSALDEEQLKLEKIDGAKNPADMFTKVVSRDKLSFCCNLVKHFKR